MPTHTSPSRAVRIVGLAAAGIIALGAPSSVAASGGASNACNGLYDVARFATYQQVGDTHGHDTVHHQFEVHGCGHHH
jgi:hypothetical protein